MHIVTAQRVIILIVANVISVDVNADMAFADVPHHLEALGVARDVIAFFVFILGAVVRRYFRVDDALFIFRRLDRRGECGSAFAVAGLAGEMTW